MKTLRQFFISVTFFDKIHLTNGRHTLGSGEAGGFFMMKLKQRDADYCNLKFLLIFLVVYGHLIEGRLEESMLCNQIYRIIYTVHMPLFCFLSGFFMKGEAGCLRSMKQMFSYYVILQAAIVIWAALYSKGGYSFFVPVWHLWYLLSLGCMAASGFFWYRRYCSLPQ